MTTSERIADIQSMTGLSEEVIRRVLTAERESIVKSLRKGESASLIGRAIIYPKLRKRMKVGTREIETYIRLSAKVAGSMESMLKDLRDFEVEETEEGEMEEELEYEINQIEALT